MKAAQVLSCLLFFSLIQAQKDVLYRIKVTPEIVAEYAQTINPFLEKRKNQNVMLNSGVGGLFASMGSINVEESRGFLNRAFEDQKALDNAMAQIHKDKGCLEYMQKIVNELTSREVVLKKSKRLPSLMKKNTYAGYKGIDKPWLKENLPDDKTFIKGAACSFMVYHLVESDGNARVEIPKSEFKKNNKKKKK